MAVSQSQVDQIIASASSDDPEVKLLKLQDEVELIKTSIKRLLIDIRERMNDLENPIVAAGGIGFEGDVSAKVASVLKDTSSAIESAADAIKSTAGTKKGDEKEDTGEKEEQLDASRESQAAPLPSPFQESRGHETAGGPAPAQSQKSAVDLLAALKSQLVSLPKEEDEVRKQQAGDKVRLQKVFRLFEWTARNVNRYGHDRVDLMLDAYHAMGYISEKNCKVVKDMAKLMPTSIGELHEIRADEFVSELYELNHILNPSDSTLDRDMIEVLMEKRETRGTQRFLAPARLRKEDASEEEYLPSRDRP